MTQQIVIAWAEKTRLVPTGRNVMRDLNWFPEFRATWEGKACMWLRAGTDADLVRANAYAATEGRTVYVFPATEADPLGRARQLAEAAARKSDGQ